MKWLQGVQVKKMLKKYLLPNFFFNGLGVYGIALTLYKPSYK